MKFKLKRPKVKIIPLYGAIGSYGLSLNFIKPFVDAAFQAKPDIVVLEVNSPGGSPVESQLISQYIIHRSNEYKIQVVAYIKDIAASGGYWLAMTASPFVFATPMSIVGSIGVVSAGFGFDKLIDQIGIERRIHTVGKNKYINDPYQPQTEESVEKIKDIQTEIYNFFVESVKAYREDHIKEEDYDKLFNGDVFVGKKSYGLIDGLYVDMISHLSECFFNKIKPNISYAIPKNSIMKKIMSGQLISSDNITDSFINKLHNKFETKTLLSYYGL